MLEGHSQTQLLDGWSPHRGRGTDSGAWLDRATVEVLRHCFEDYCHIGSAALGLQGWTPQTEPLGERKHGETRRTSANTPHGMQHTVQYKHIQTKAALFSPLSWQTGCLTLCRLSWSIYIVFILFYIHIYWRLKATRSFGKNYIQKSFPNICNDVTVLKQLAAVLTKIYLLKWKVREAHLHRHKSVLHMSLYSQGSQQ